jgi:hypothetical protein
MLKHPVILDIDYFIRVASHQLLLLALLQLVHGKALLAADAVRQPDPLKWRIFTELDAPAAAVAAAAKATLAEQQQHHTYGRTFTHVTLVSN